MTVKIIFGVVHEYNTLLDSGQRAAWEAAEKVAFATASYQGMTLVVPQSVQNKRRALAPVIRSTLRKAFFRSLGSRAAGGPAKTQSNLGAPFYRR